MGSLQKKVKKQKRATAKKIIEKFEAAKSKAGDYQVIFKHEQRLGQRLGRLSRGLNKRELLARRVASGQTEGRRRAINRIQLR